MRGTLAFGLMMVACRGSSAAPDASAAPAASHGPPALYCKATASTCVCSDYVGGHDYGLSCDRNNACTCTTDGAKTKTFTSSGCSATEWQQCGYPEK